MSRFLTICSVLLTVGYCAKIPNSIRCSIKDSNFDECLKAAIQNVLRNSKTPIREIGLPALEPLDIPAMTIKSGSAVNFTQHYTNVQILGLSGTKCDTIKMDFDTHVLHLECDIPQAKLVFQYEFNGRLLLLPIVGKGPGTLDITHLRIKMTFNLEEYNKKGTKYYKIKSSKALADPQLLRFKLENLFDGNKALGDNINQVLNDNWIELWKDVKSSYEEAFLEIYAHIFKRVLMKVSAGELWDEK